MIPSGRKAPGSLGSVRALLWVLVLLAPAWAEAGYLHNLRWRVPSDPDVAGYRVYVRFAYGKYPRHGSCAASSLCRDIGFVRSRRGSDEANYVIDDLPEGEILYARMTAYDFSGNESPFSDREVRLSDADISVLGIRASRQQPFPPGEPVGLRAFTSGGTGPLEFKWFVRDSAGLRVLRDWSVIEAVTWTPLVASGGQTIGVWVRSAGSVADTWGAIMSEGDSWLESVEVGIPPVLLEALVASPPSPQLAGRFIQLAATASGGLGAYEFRWEVQGPASRELLQDWSAASTYSWREPDPGRYYVVVRVRAAGVGDAGPSDVASLRFELY